MTSPLRAYLLDPTAATLAAVMLPPDDDGGRHRAAICALIDCHQLDAISLTDDLTAYVDDEGLAQPHAAVWSLTDAPGTPYVGRAVIVSHNQDGDTAPCHVPGDQIARLLTVARCMVRASITELAPTFDGEFGAFVSAARVGELSLTLERTPLRVLA